MVACQDASDHAIHLHQSLRSGHSLHSICQFWPGVANFVPDRNKLLVLSIHSTVVTTFSDRQFSERRRSEQIVASLATTVSDGHTGSQILCIAPTLITAHGSKSRTMGGTVVVRRRYFSCTTGAGKCAAIPTTRVNDFARYPSIVITTVGGRRMFPWDDRSRVSRGCLPPPQCAWGSRCTVLRRKADAHKASRRCHASTLGRIVLSHPNYLGAATDQSS